MLHELTVRRLAVIEDLSVRFGPGLNVLTGETGAGKSILVTAIGLALGWRAAADMIRTGCEDAEIEARLDLDGDSRARCADMDLPAENTCRISRLIQLTGRNRAGINDAPVNLSFLRQLGETLINLYGQHEAQGLMRPEVHLELLDAYAGLTGQSTRVRELVARWKKLEARLADLRRKEQEREARAGYLRFVVKEIDNARIQPGEDEELQAQRTVLANAETLSLLAREVAQVVYEQETGSVVEQVGVLLRKVEEKTALDERLAPLADTLREAAALTEDIALRSRQYADGLENDPAQLANVEDRLEALRDLKKKYGGSLEAVLACGEDSAAELDSLEKLTGEIELAGKELQKLSGELSSAAGELSRARGQAAKKMEQEVERELEDLDMAGTRFIAPVDPLESGSIRLKDLYIDENGADQVEFLISPNVGEQPRPLIRIASGGELSRIMLAIKHVLSRHFPVPTLIFDEVDSGVGGAQAERLGRKLREVAAEHQVLCITHLPQIAALADSHYVVSKTSKGGRTRTHVELLSEQGRVEELARMLGGKKISETTRQAARELMDAR